MKHDQYPAENSYNALRAHASKSASGLIVAELDYDESKTMRAWETLLSGGEDRADSNLPVRSLIHDSWSRCATGGIDAQQHEAPLESDKDVVENYARANGELLSAAQRSFGAIGRLLDGTGAMFVLADSDGVLIDTIGDKRTIFDGMDIHLAVGGKWTEDVVGTNGIGTALWTGEPIFVHAAEHFCAGIKSWTCAGAPIRDPFDGKIVGVVDLSGHPNIFRPHNIALVATAAREIEMALADFQNEERARLLEAFIASGNSYRASDGLMILDRHGRAIYSNNVPGTERKSFGETTRQGNRSPRLPELTDTAFLDSVTTALPDELRSYHVSPLNLNGNLRGVALVFPRTITGSSVSVVKKTASQHLRDQASLIVGESEALLAAVDIACRVAESGVRNSLRVLSMSAASGRRTIRSSHLTAGRSPRIYSEANCSVMSPALLPGLRGMASLVSLNSQMAAFSA